jgi:Rho GTPase-activating protein 1
MDYVAILFAQPMEHRPTYGWMIKAYKALTRKYKKNIKKLYIVHPSAWFKILLWLMSHVLRYSG